MNTEHRAGLLCWPIRQSLLRYLAEIDDSTIRATGRAFLADGAGIRFAFPRSAEDAAAEVLASFEGGVSLGAYGGMLSIEFESPWIEEWTSGLFLTVMSEGERVSLASLHPLGPLVGVANGQRYDAAFTSDGAYLFGPQYSPGQSLDPLELM